MSDILIPNEPRILEAIARLSTTPDGKVVIDHFRQVLTGLDVQSRRMTGDAATVMGGRRIQLEETLLLFDNIGDIINKKREAQRLMEARNREYRQ